MLDKYFETIYRENIKIHSEDKQKKAISNVNGRFKHLKKHIGDVNPKSLDTDVVNRYIKLRREERKPNRAKYSDGSINFELTLLKSATKALGNGLKFTIKDNMKGHVKLEQVEREVILSDTEFENILQKFKEYDREHHYTSNYSFFLEVLMFTGVRWGQLQLLEYQDINFDESRLEFPAWKTKHEKTKKHIVYVDSEIMIDLNKAMKSRDIIKDECNCSDADTCDIMKSDFVFINKHKRCQHFSKDMFYILWNSFCEDLGYVKVDKYKKGGQESKILPHDIRRTRIVKLIGQVWDRKYIMSQTGHRSHSTFDKYNVIQQETMHSPIESQSMKEREIRERTVVKRNTLENDTNDRMESIWEI